MAWKLEPEAKSGGWRLEEQPEAKPQTSIEDIGKSVVQGGKDLVEGVAGLPGAVEGLGFNLAGPLRSAIYGPQSTADKDKQWARTLHAPTPEEIGALLNKITPEYHSPTEAGQFAETATSFLPAALAPGSAITRALRVAVPAATSEGAGAITKGSDLEPFARAAGGLVGMGGLELTRNIFNRFGLTPDQRALRFIDKAMRDAKITPQALPAAANKVQAAGGSVEEFLFEILGEPGKKLARAAANVPGPTSQIAQDALEARREGVGSRVAAAASKATGVGGKGGVAQIGEYLEKLQQARQTQAGPLYDTAYKAEVPDDVFQRDLKPIMMGDGASAKARSFATQHAEADITRHQAALSKATRAGNAAAAPKAETDLADARLARDQLLALSDPNGAGPKSVNVRALDYFQRGMRSIAEDQGVHTSLGSANLAGQREFNSLLDVEVPEFAKARSFIAENKAQEEAIELGRGVFKMDDFDVKNQIGKLAPSAKEAWFVGVMRAIQDNLNRGDTTFVTRLAGSRGKGLRESLTEALGGAKKFAPFLKRIEREADMVKADNFVRAGSRTTPMAADIKSLTEGEGELGMIDELAKSGGNVKDVFLRRIAEAYGRLKQGHFGVGDPRVNESLGTQLFSPAKRDRIKSLVSDLSAPSYANRFNQPPPAYPLALSGIAPRKSAQDASDEELLQAIGAK